MRPKRLHQADLKTTLDRMLLDNLHRRQPAAGEDLTHDESDEAQKGHRHRQISLRPFLLTWQKARLEQHLAPGGHRLVGDLEEVVVAFQAEVLERLDRNDPVHRLVELLPALQQHSLRARTVRRGEELFDVRLLVPAQGQTHDVDVVLFHRAHHRGAPAATDVEQRHTRPQLKSVKCEVDLRKLCLFERHIVALVVCAAVGPGRIQEE